jgi:hypothetical protein
MRLTSWELVSYDLLHQILLYCKVQLAFINNYLKCACCFHVLPLSGKKMSQIYLDTHVSRHVLVYRYMRI